MRSIFSSFEHGLLFAFSLSMIKMNQSFFALAAFTVLFSSATFAQELSPEITKQAESVRAINLKKATVEESFLNARALKTKSSEDLALARILVFELKAEKKLGYERKNLGAPTIEEAIAKAEADVTKKQALLDQAKEKFDPISESYQEVRHQSNFAEKTLKSMIDEHYFNHCGRKSLKQNSREQIQKALILMANSEKPTREKDEIKLELLLMSGQCAHSQQDAEELELFIEENSRSDISSPAESGGTHKAE